MKNFLRAVDWLAVVVVISILAIFYTVVAGLLQVFDVIDWAWYTITLPTIIIIIFWLWAGGRMYNK